MGTYTPTKQLASTAAVRAKEWTLDDPLVRLEISRAIPQPIKFEEDNTTYLIAAENALATTSIGTGWIESGRTYMLFVMVRFELDDSNDDLKISILERSTGSNVVIDGSVRDQHKRFNPPTNHYGTYNFVTTFTASGASTDGPIVYIEHTAGNSDAHQAYAQMVLIDITDMTEGNDYFYEEDSTDSDNTVTPVKKDEATLNLTKDNEGVWLLGTAVQYKCRTDDDFRVSTIISNQDDTVLSGDLITLDSSEADDEHVLNYTTILNNDLSDTSWNISLYTYDEQIDSNRPAQQNTVQHTKVWGIRLDKFVSTTFQNHVTISTSGTDLTKVTAAELTNVTAQFDSPKFLVIHGGLGKLSNVGSERKNLQFYTDVQWKKNGGTYSRFGDDDQQTYSTMVWKGNGEIPVDYDSEISWWSTVPPETLSDIKKGDVLSFKLEIWKDIIDIISTRDVDCDDLYLGVIELPQNTDRLSDSSELYSLIGNHEELIVGPTTLQRCIDTRNKMLNVRGFRFPERWDTLWTIDTSEKL